MSKKLSVIHFPLSIVMKFHLIWVGKTKNKHWRALQEDYLQRLSHFVKYSITEIKDKAKHESIEIEGNRILEKVNQSSFVCLLDVRDARLVHGNSRKK